MAGAAGRPEADPRYELVLAQATRGITQQQATLDNMRARAGTLVATASLVSSFLGAATLATQDPPASVVVLTVLALAALIVALAAGVLILWPYEWRWGINTHALLGDYVEAETPADLDELRRSIAYYMQQDYERNAGKLALLLKALQVAVIAIGVEVLAWTVALALR